MPRHLLKRARLWRRFAEDYTPLKNRKPPVGQALTVEQQERLFTLAKSRPEWRSPTLNATCLDVVGYLRSQSATLGFAQPEHFVFPWHGRNKRLDPTRGMTSWRTAWRSIRKAAGLTEFRFHDGRHTAITTLAEKETADGVIQAQVGHVAPEMMKTYSHIRREALNQAAVALEPPKASAPNPPLIERSASISSSDFFTPLTTETRHLVALSQLRLTSAEMSFLYKETGNGGLACVTSVS